MDAVATTGLLVAALRAREQERTDDPFAHALAGDAGYAALDAYRAAAGAGIPIIEVRTKYYDDALAEAVASGIRQVVIVAAGMDARAYRIAWPSGTRLFELDQPEVLARKAQILATHTPRCERIAIGIDLRTDWAHALRDAGLDPSARTVWMMEGLLQYLPASAVHGLTRRVAALSAPGSVALYDVVGLTMLAAPFLRGALGYMEKLGAPWVFGSDEPASLFPGWDVTLTDPAVLGNALGRWPFPAAPPHVPGMARGYLVRATKP